MIKGYAVSRKLLNISVVLIVDIGKDNSVCYFTGNPVRYTISNDLIFQKEGEAFIKLRHLVIERIRELQCLLEKMEE